jgi:hypothetical protein
MIAQSVAAILNDHIKLSVEGIDRMYLNVYVPWLQTCENLDFCTQTKAARGPFRGQERKSPSARQAHQRQARAARSGIASGHDCGGLDHQDHAPFGRARAMQYSLRHSEPLIGQQLD